MGRAWEISERHWQNIAVSALIVAAHILLLRVQWSSQVKRNQIDVVSLLRLLPLPESTSQPVIERPVRLEMPQQPVIDSIQPAMPTISQAVITPLANNESDEPPAGTLPKIDWRETSAQTAAELARRGSKETYRSLDSRSGLKQAPTEEKLKNSIFPPPLHKLGETQQLDNGEAITWLNDRCYMTNHPPPSANARSVGAVCKRFSKTPRSDLFDSAKPDYLRKPMEELPVPRETR